MPLLGTYNSLIVEYDPPGNWDVVVGANGEHIATFTAPTPPPVVTGTVTVTLNDGGNPHGQQVHTNLPTGSTATSSNGMTSVKAP